MICLDCLSGQEAAVPAVGVCVDCGAAVRRRHAQLDLLHRTVVAPVNRVVPVGPPARRLT